MKRILVENQQLALTCVGTSVHNNGQCYYIQSGDVNINTNGTQQRAQRDPHPFVQFPTNKNARHERPIVAKVTIEVGFLQENRGYGQASPPSNVSIKLHERNPRDTYSLFANISARHAKLEIRLDNVNANNDLRGFRNVRQPNMAGKLPWIKATLTDADISVDARLGTSCYEKIINDAESLDGIQPYWYSHNYNITATLTITEIYPEKEVLDVDSAVDDKLCITKKILSEEIASDVTIILQNGTAIKCHKSFLSAHSTVFQTMFQTSMKESETSIVEIFDMAESSVRAFLAYLYYWETKEAAKNSLICFELFHAGHKYDIGKLEECMEKMLLAKSNEWYDVDVGMRLFLFARNLGEASALKMKAIQVLKSKFSELEKSKSYQQLFKKDPKAAMELCKYAFSV